jgi:hypothetical protein
MYKLNWLAVFIFLTSITACDSEDKFFSRTVIEVNQHSMSVKEFSEKVSKRLRQFDSLSAKNPAHLFRIKESVLKDFVIECFTRDWAKAHGIELSKEEVEKSVHQLRSKYPDDLSLRRALTQEQISIEEWQKQSEIQILKDKVLSELTKSLTPPTVDQIKDIYVKNKNHFLEPERAQLRQIVLSKESDAELVFEKLKKGAAFEELAKKYSVAPEKEKGGNLGWMEKGVLPVFDQAFKLKLWQHSEIIKSDFGFHIIELLAKEPAKTLTLEQADKQIRSQLMEEKVKAVYKKWLEEQARLAKVKRDDTLIKSIYVETKPK